MSPGTWLITAWSVLIPQASWLVLQSWTLIFVPNYETIFCGTKTLALNSSSIVFDLRSWLVQGRHVEFPLSKTCMFCRGYFLERLRTKNMYRWVVRSQWFFGVFIVCAWFKNIFVGCRLEKTGRWFVILVMILAQVDVQHWGSCILLSQ